MKLGTRELVFITVMLGMMAGAYFLIFQKANAARAELEAKIQQKQLALANLEQATAGVDDVKGKIDELQKAIAFFESKLPQKREVEIILKEVWQMAEKNNLQARTIKTLKSERGPGCSEQPIEMSLSGNFYGFYAFLQQLERLPRITKVVKMDLMKINDRDGDMEAKVTLIIYYEPEANVGLAQAASVH
jgi:type IV pilus assembly protein PilO